MGAQTSYQRLQNVAYAGLVYAQAPTDIISGIVEGANLAPGLAVSRGTTDQGVIVGGGEFYGVSVRALDLEGDSNAVLEYVEGDTSAILRSGYIWAVCLSGCVPGDIVQYFTQTAEDAQPGNIFAGTFGAGEPLQANLDAGLVQVATGATWESTTEVGGIGLLRLTANTN